MRCDRLGGLSHGWVGCATKKVQIGWSNLRERAKMGSCAALFRPMQATDSQ
jgi:hypothetical protein